MTTSPVIHLLYLILIPTAGFIFDNPVITVGLLLLQLVIWFALNIPFSKFSQLRRVRRFAIVILVVFSFFHGHPDFVLFSIFEWKVGLSLSGLKMGLLMLSKLAIMILAAQIVLYRISPTEVISGLKALGLSSDSATVMHALLQLAAAQPHNQDRHRKNVKGAGSGQGKGAGGSGSNFKLRALLRGDLTAVYDLIEKQRTKMAAQFENSDLANMASASALIVMIRSLKIAPGLPIAPGHKNVLLVPFFILGSARTKKSLSGAKIGFFSGVIHFISGFGKYGPLGVVQFVLLGSVIDALLILFRNTNSLVNCALIGFFAGLFRVSSEILIAWLLNVPIEFYLFYLPFIISHCIFGALSAPITKQFLNRFS